MQEINIGMFDSFNISWLETGSNHLRLIVNEGFMYISSVNSISYLMQMDSNGNKVWMRNISVNATPTSLLRNPSGSVYVIGQCIAAFAGQTYMGGLDIFAMKFDRSGAMLWIRILGSSSDDFVGGGTLDAF